MRGSSGFLLAASIAILAGCTQSPEQKEVTDIKQGAASRAAAIDNQAEAQAAPLDQQAEGLRNQAKQAGGYAGKRLDVRADALAKEAKLIREQADGQSAAVKEAADARVKALRSR